MEAQHYVSVFILFFTFTFTFTQSLGQAVPAVFVFGDSFVDVGNNNYLPLSLAKANFPHNGVDFPGRRATGRFSNGKNAADFLAEKVGLATSPPYLSISNKANAFLGADFLAEKVGLATFPPYLSIANKTNAFLGGVSFASGGAGIIDGTDQIFKQAIPLSKQVEIYSTVYTEIVQQIGSVEAQKYFSKSLYGIVIGSNDILGYFRAGSNAQLTNTPQELVTSMIINLTGYLKSLYNLGARKFVVVGIGAIGCCPSQRHQNQSGECKQETNYWSRKYNEGLKTLLQEMKSEFKDIHYTYFDTYSVLLNLIQKPAQYGFTEVKAGCCGLGTLNAKIECLPVSQCCSTRRDHVFWDLYHPTEAAAKILVDMLYEGSQQYAFPVNGRQLAAL